MRLPVGLVSGTELCMIGDVRGPVAQTKAFAPEASCQAVGSKVHKERTKSAGQNVAWVVRLLTEVICSLAWVLVSGITV